MRSQILAILFCTAFVGSCLAQSSSKPESVDLFEPHDYGGGDAGHAESEDITESAAPDTGTAAPAPRIEPASNYPWLPQDRPIRFHTLAESAATREQWEPLIERGRDHPRSAFQYPDNPLTTWIEVKFSADELKDENLAHLSPILTTSKPSDEPLIQQIGHGFFIGLGDPFRDDYLHFFEVGGTYFMGDYLVQSNSYSTRIRFIKDPNTPAAPEDVAVGMHLPLSPRLWPWFLSVIDATGLILVDREGKAHDAEKVCKSRARQCYRHKFKDDDKNVYLPLYLYLEGEIQSNVSPAYATTKRNILWISCSFSYCISVSSKDTIYSMGKISVSRRFISLIPPGL